jgi:hypothetical protein
MFNKHDRHKRQLFAEEEVVFCTEEKENEKR